MTKRIVLCVAALAMGASGEMHRTSERHLDTGWRFMRFDLGTKEPAGVAGDAFDASAWRLVRLPHDWGVEQPFTMHVSGNLGRLRFYGIAWYKTTFEVPKEHRGDACYLDFDGAMSCAEVYVNGQRVAFQPNGFFPFRADATDALVPGTRQTLAVRLDNRWASGRWYHGGGLYRRVKLGFAPRLLRVAANGLSIATKVDGARAAVKVRARVEGDGETNEAQAEARIFRKGSPDALATVKGVRMPQRHKDFSFDLSLENPALWSDVEPNLYELEVRLSLKNRTDRYRQTFGVRTVEFRPREGMFVNGRHVKMRGVCQHSDAGALGTAAYRQTFERQVRLLKEMGCNAIRTAHNPPSADLLEICDEQGMFVIDEAFDMWMRYKGGKDAYAKWFPDWWARNLSDFIRRDRCSPCVVMWSIGNEVNEQAFLDEGLPIGRALTALVHMEDPTRPVTMGNNRICTVTNGLAAAVDVFGCNYMPDHYRWFYEANPDMGMWGSETESMISSRGAYFFPEDVDYSQIVRPQWKGMYDWQVSSYDLFPIRQSNYPPEVEFAAQKEFPQCYGNFVWTGFDYLGECSPYEKDRPHFRYTTPERERHFKKLMEANKDHAPTGRSSYYGILDLCGFPKDRYYCYQAEWRPEKPMAHLLPHWTWPGRVGKVTPVHAYTSGDEAELFLNGRSLGRRRKADAFRLMWNDVRYEPGELRLVAYKGGRQWAEAVQRTAGPAARLDAQAERRELASLQDLAYVTIALRDEKGTLVPESDVDLSFAATGSVEVIGVCNGDPTDMTGLQADHQRTFHGLCQAVVRLREGAHGPGELKVSGGGLSAIVPFSGPRQ